MKKVKLPLRLIEQDDAFVISDFAGTGLGAFWFTKHPEWEIVRRRVDPGTARHLAQLAADAATRAALAEGPDDGEVDAVIAEFGGDPRSAIRGLLQDLETLARDAERVVSRGYVRGRFNLRRSWGG